MSIYKSISIYLYLDYQLNIIHNFKICLNCVEKGPKEYKICYMVISGKYCIQILKTQFFLDLAKFDRSWPEPDRNRN